MPTYDFHTVDVFTDRLFGGNPLAVFPQADGLSSEQMQLIAREFNLSETTFVLSPRDPANTAQVRIFGPTQELPFAGHPNVGTGFVLANSRPELTGPLRFEEAAGLVTVDILRGAAGQATGAIITAPQPLLQGGSIAPEIVAACGSLQPVDLAAAFPPLRAGVGVEFVFAEVRSRDALRRAKPNRAAFEAAAARHPNLSGSFQIMFFWRDPTERQKVSARMFAPLIGIPEDPATGAASAALSALLLVRDGRDRASYAIEQGADMGRLSRIAGEALRDAAGNIAAKVGGSCFPVTRGKFQL